MRLVAAVALAALVVVILVTQADLRVGEAVLAQWFVQEVTSGRAVAAGTRVYFGIGTDDVVGLSITALCSTVVFVAPLVALAAAIVAMTRSSLPRVAFATALGIALVVICNLTRFAGAAWAFDQFGAPGFDLVHRYIGSIFVLVAFVGAIVLVLAVALRQSSRNRGSNVRGRR